MNKNPTVHCHSYFEYSSIKRATKCTNRPPQRAVARPGRVTQVLCYFYPLDGSKALHLALFLSTPPLPVKKTTTKIVSDYLFYVIFCFQTTMVYFNASGFKKQCSKAKKLRIFHFMDDVTKVKFSAQRRREVLNLVGNSRLTSCHFTKTKISTEVLTLLFLK